MAFSVLRYIGRVKKVYILPHDIGPLGKCETDGRIAKGVQTAVDRIENNIISLLVGSFAEVILFGEPRLGKGSVDKCDEFIKLLYPADKHSENQINIVKEDYGQRALDLVKDYWPQIEAVAKALMEQGELNKKQVTGIIKSVKV